jgi:acyl-CoA thioester hydrolase
MSHKHLPQPDPEASRSIVRVRVRFCETDLMGIVHHGSYPAYFEVARVEWLRRRGVDYRSWSDRGLRLAVAELTVRYRTPARFDDELDVDTTVGLLRAASVRFDYRLLRVADGDLVAEASTMLACVNEAGALTRMSPEVAEVLRRAEGTHAPSWIAPPT